MHARGRAGRWCVILIGTGAARPDTRLHGPPNCRDGVLPPAVRRRNEANEITNANAASTLATGGGRQLNG